MGDNNDSATGSILIVDDNPQNRSVTRRLLVAEGYDVLLATSGAEALALFAEEPTDLVLLDVMMPDINGFETCRRLRLLSVCEGTAIVFLTGLTDLGSHQSALDAGADDFLIKPIRRTELVLRVRSLLRIKQISTALKHSGELVRDQRDALIRAQQQREEITRFLVHDLKNPIASILANMQVTAYDPSLSQLTKDSVADTISAAESLHRMVLDLLDVARSEDGALVPRRSDVDLVDIVRHVCNAVGTRAEQAGKVLSTNVDRAPVIVSLDQDIISRVVANLVDNAIKYSTPGANVHVEIDDAGRPEFIELRVSDEGDGIPSEMRERVFEKYARVENEGTQLRPGSGLGLTFCRLAVEAHGGRIWVGKNYPNGSIFHVRLPAHQRTAGNASAGLA